MEGPSPTRRQSAIAICAIAVAALFALLPWVHFGIPSGHDFEFHVNSWVEVLTHWKQGVIFPHWATLAHYGYGEARFVFYPPLSWTLGAALGAILNWKLVPGAYVWLALTLSGISMFFLAKKFLTALNATFAAMFYALNPYQLIVVYWRSALAELSAAACLPLLLLCALRLAEGDKRTVVPLAFVLAAGWLTNVPCAVMMYYSLALLLVYFAVSNRSLKPATYGLIAAIGGIGLAAFYLVPVWDERTWASLDQVLSPGVRPQDNFLFLTTSDADHNRFNLLVSVVAISEFVLAALAFSIWRGKHNRKRWWPLTLWSAFCVLVMFSFTLPLWEFLPELRYVQLPWRWLLAFNVSFALAVVIAFPRWWLRSVVCVVALASVLIAGHRILAPWWDTSADIREMVDNQHDGIGNEGADEYVPAGADPYAIDPNAPLAKFEGTGHASIAILKWTAEDRTILTTTSSSGSLVLRLFNYPSWQVKVNGRIVPTQTTTHTGQLMLPVPPGENRIQITFVGSWDRRLGVGISLLVLIALGSWHFFVQRSDHHGGTSGQMANRHEPNSPELPAMKRVLIATSNPGKIRDFAGVASHYGIEPASIPNFSTLPSVVEDGNTFEANARKKAEVYSRSVPGQIVIADDSGLEVDALGGAPGVHSARYAVNEPHGAECNTEDNANNAKLIREIRRVPTDKRTGRFVCWIAAARDGVTLEVFEGKAEGVILDQPRGSNGFGYDPLFYFPQIGKTFAELSAVEKAHYSHRGAAFRKFLEWYRESGPKSVSRPI